ncbi:hypothetical protein EV715DRAFT_254607 [Schizophyllum commune]
MPHLIIKTRCHSPASSSLASRPPPGRKPTTQTPPAYRRPAMQAASHGARASVRSAPSLSAWSAVSAPRLARSIHTSHTAKLRHTATSTARNASSSATGGAKGLFERSRAFMNNLVAHLTAPGIGVKPHGPYAARAPIHSGYSLPLRTALARPALSTPATFLPRAPGVPRSIAQVGLGTARNFSTARPIFQSLAENVPVATRALIEAGPDTRRAKHRAQARKMAKQDKENGRAFRAPGFEKQQKKLTQEEKVAKKEQAMKQYFAAPSQPAVITQLLIPLAPTPTERVPLAPSTTLAETIMPLMEVASVHATHGSHRMRVASLFDRLDGARVWDRGVSCSAYSQLAGASGVCTVLKVEFVGWTKAEVRSVIGESGTGWCVLEEVETAAGADLTSNDDMSGYDSDVLSEISGLTGSEMDAFSEPDLDFSSPSTIDPSQSFVLPTLDFSSSFTANAHSAAASVSDLSSALSDVGPDSLSDSVGYAAVSSTSSPVFIDPPSENGWYTFSSDFGRRSGMLPGEENQDTLEQGL